MASKDEKITVTHLRANLYKLLDELIEKGIPIEIKRKGKTIVIALKEAPSIFDRLERKELTPSKISEEELIYHGYGIPEDDKSLYFLNDGPGSIAAEDEK